MAPRCGESPLPPTSPPRHLIAGCWRRAGVTVLWGYAGVAGSGCARCIGPRCAVGLEAPYPLSLPVAVPSTALYTASLLGCFFAAGTGSCSSARLLHRRPVCPADRGRKRAESPVPQRRRAGTAALRGRGRAAAGAHGMSAPVLSQGEAQPDLLPFLAACSKQLTITLHHAAGKGTPAPRILRGSGERL